MSQISRCGPLEALPGYEKIKRKPRLRAGPVDAELVQMFAKSNNVPSFSFIDPFGYSGLSLRLVEALVNGFGSDMVLFFSFDSINRALSNPKVKDQVDALFGDKRADRLRQTVKDMGSEDREEVLIEAFIAAVTEDLGYEFVIPYVFEKEDKDRTSHYLIFISKRPLGFNIMKQIMYKQSEDKTQGMAKFGYVRQVSAEKTPLLHLMHTPLNDFAKQLCDEYAGQQITRKALREHYDKYRPRNLFVDKNCRRCTSIWSAARLKKRPQAAPDRLLGDPAEIQRGLRRGDGGRARRLHAAARSGAPSGLSRRDLQATRRRDAYAI